jgi:pimeloyl-ACP methyl ester carboxylesterase
MKRRPVSPLRPGWVIVDGLPMYYRYALDAPADAPTLVHVHGFGISGTYLERTAAMLAPRYRTYVPDLPGMGRSLHPESTPDLPGLARALIEYCDAVGIERATFVGNSLGCPVIIEVASTFPDRIDRAVLVSPAGGPNNQPMGRAIRQMIFDAPREPMGLLPIAVGDYLRFGFIQGWSLFKAMTAYPTLDNLRNLLVPTLVIAGQRDPLVNLERVHVFSGLPHVDAVAVTGAHALNFSHPDLIAGLIDAFMEGRPYAAPPGSTDSVSVLEVPDAAPEPAPG